MTSLQGSSNSEAIEGEVLSPSVNTSVDYKQILVQTPDGATWRAELVEGELVLKEKLHAPETSSPEPTAEEEDTASEPSEPEEPEEAEPSEPEEEEVASESSEYEESDVGETYEDMFSPTDPASGTADIDELIDSLPTASGVPEAVVS